MGNGEWGMGNEEWGMSDEWIIFKFRVPRLKFRVSSLKFRVLIPFHFKYDTNTLVGARQCRALTGNLYVT
ncbi:MAG: hypothetical protein HEQ35_14535 [Gloeotrichia echinulata IR180]|jgi:hypothetical protein|nr:hypothetical protein [Gloeotrichia echinulata DEX184]